MKMLTALRPVDANDLPVENSAARLNHLGYQPQYETFLTGKNYLRFNAQFEDASEMIGFIDVAVWLSHSLPSIEGIDWNSVDQPVLYSLIVAHPLDFDLVSQHAPLIRISAAELVSDTSTLATLPRLATSTGTILVAQFTYGNALECPRGAANIENKLVTDLDFVVGASKFPIASLPAIEVGDVLVIEHVTEQISCNGKILFNYTLMQESIMITNPNDNEVQYDAQTDRDQLVGIDALPIDLSFVLMKKSVTFAELKAMAPGEMVELPATQVMNIEIRANQRSFGRGELVQLTNGQLAVEIRQILS